MRKLTFLECILVALVVMVSFKVKAQDSAWQLLEPLPAPRGAQTCLPNGITFSTQGQIDSFPLKYSDCTETLGDIFIFGYTGLDDITNLDSLIQIISIGGGLIIGGNDSLTSLHGLDNITSISGLLWIDGSDALTNLSGLENLTDVGGSLTITDNDALANLDGLTSLSHIGAEVSIGGRWRGNPALTDLDGFISLTYVGGNLAIHGNTSLTNLSGLANLTSVQGDLEIVDNAVLTNLGGLDNISSVEGDLYIGNNVALTNLNGPANLASVGGALTIDNNDALISLIGLDNITSVRGSLFIRNNLAMTSLNGLDNVSSIGSLSISNNEVLTSISGLSNLASVGGNLFIDNNAALTSLNGLDHVTSIGGPLIRFTSNNVLSTCGIQSICDYLDHGGMAFIEGNAPGCSSGKEVKASCDSTTGSRQYDPQALGFLRVYPNPFKDITTFQFDLKHSEAVSLVIYDGLTRPVAKLIDHSILMGEQRITWNASDVIPGIYFYRFQVETASTGGKLVRLK